MGEVGDGGLLVDPSAGVDAWLEAFALLWDDEDAYARHASRAELNGRRADATAAEAADRFETLLRQSTSAAAGADGEGGIRTLDGGFPPYSLSRRVPSATRPPLPRGSMLEQPALQAQ
jgi:hypothetical protein